LQLFGKWLLELFVFGAIFQLILLAAIGGVMGEGDHCLLFHRILSFRWKLLGEHVGKVMILLFEGNLEET
jgi:hypothetical protein